MKGNRKMKKERCVLLKVEPMPFNISFAQIGSHLHNYYVEHAGKRFAIANYVNFTFEYYAWRE